MSFFKWSILYCTILLLLYGNIDFLRADQQTTLLFNDGWQYRWGDSPVDSSGIPLWLGDDPADTCWQTMQLPDHAPNRQGNQFLWQRALLPDTLYWADPTILFFSIDQVGEIYINGEKIYTSGDWDIVNKKINAGYSLPIVHLKPEHAGKFMYVRAFSRHKSIGIIGKAMIGNPDDHLKMLIVDDLDRLLASALFLFFGLFAFVLFVIRSGRVSYLIFSFLSISFGLWNISEVMFLRIIHNYPLFWFYLNYLSLYSFPISLIALIETIFDTKYKIVIRRLWQLHTLWLVTALVCNQFHWILLHQTITYYQLLLIVEMIIIGAIIIIFALKGNAAARLLTAGTVLIILFGSYDLYGHMGFDPLPRPRAFWGMLGFIFSLGILLEWKYEEAYQYMIKLNQAYERFVPHEFLSFLGRKSIIEVKLGDFVELEMTILYLDIRKFTTLSEGMSPEDNFKFINGFLSRMEPNIKKHNGFIDKYIGDAIMALFPPTSADEGLHAAISMLKSLADYNQTRTTPRRPPLEIGIGLNTGTLMLGTVGGHDRMDGTVISDAVNLANRMEGLTKYYGANLLISEYTYQRLKDKSAYHIRYIDHVQLKGLARPIHIYEVFNGDNEKVIELKIRSLEWFDNGMNFYQKAEFSLALQNFGQVLQINPADKTAEIYLNRCKKYSNPQVQKNWTGIEFVDVKNESN